MAFVVIYLHFHALFFPRRESATFFVRHNDDEALLGFFGLVRLNLSKLFARWVYKNTNARDDMTMRCFCFGLVRLYLSKLFARWVYKNTNARDDMTMRCFFCFGLVRSRHSEPCACILVNDLQDGFTKYKRTR
jgi:hypothetical protein